MLSKEEKKAIEDSKDILKELNKHKDKDFIGRLYYKNKPIEDILQILLNLIEKQNKIIETNKENWLLVQNEVLGYAQGYEDGKQHKQTATAMVIENRKYQIIGEEIKRYKAIIEKQQAEIEKKDKIIDKLAEELVDVRGDCPFDRYDFQEIDCDNICNNDGIEKKCWIEYFTNKVERNNK